MKKNVIFCSVVFFLFLAVPTFARAENYFFTPLTKYFLTNAYSGDKVLIKIGIFTRQNIDNRTEKTDLLKDWKIHQAFISAFLAKDWKEKNALAMAREAGFIEIIREKRMNLRGKQKDRVIAYLYVCDDSPLWNREIYRGRNRFYEYTRMIAGKVEDCVKYDYNLR